MRYLKMLGWACIAGCLIAAFVGGGSAQATELCKTTEDPCTEDMMYGPLQNNTTKEIHFELKEGTESVFKSGFATTKCKKTTFQVLVDKTGSSTETAGGKITSIKWEECGSCTITALKNGTIEIHTDKQPETTANIDDNGTVTGLGTEFTETCSGVSCIFGTATGGTALGTLDGGPDPVLTANAKLPWFAGDSSNSICTLGTGTATLTAEYTPTEALYVI